MRKTIFDTFPLLYPRLDLTFESTPYLLLIPDLNLYAVMDGTYTIKRLVSISHIRQVHTRWSLLWEQIPLVVHYGQGTADAMLAYALFWFLGYTSLFLFPWALYGYLSYGVCRRWSIWTMPAILRNFVYQTDASLSVIGSSLSYDQGGSRCGQMTDLQHYAVIAL